MTMRRGVTVIEMLVATGVFMIGFTAVYTLFLFGMRNRALSDATLNGTLAATSHIAMMRLYATNEPRLGNETDISADPIRFEPYSFIGDGNPRSVTTTTPATIIQPTNSNFANGAEWLSKPAALASVDTFNNAARMTFDDELYSSPDQPATYLRVIDATSLRGDRSDPETGGYRVILIAATIGYVGPTITFEELCTQRYRITEADPDDALVELMDKETVQRFDAVLYRSVLP